MRRTVRLNQHGEDYPYMILNDLPTDDFLQMDIVRTNDNSNNNAYRFENTIEAKVETSDTLQAIALRFYCTVADIKRLNKIDKDNEIHARKVIKIPITVHNVLLDNLPTVHQSGNNSPKLEQKSGDRNSCDSLNGIVRNPLEDANSMLCEKLIVASVNSSNLDKPSTIGAELELKSIYSQLQSGSAPLITDILDNSTNMPQLRRIRGPSLRAMDWSGSDCDMSWICLFVFILSLCFVIPLVYVFYIAEHAHHNTTGLVAALHH